MIIFTVLLYLHADHEVAVDSIRFKSLRFSLRFYFNYINNTGLKGAFAVEENTCFWFIYNHKVE